MAEYIGIRPTFATGVNMQGASGATGVVVAAAVINAGVCDTVLVVMGSTRAERAQGAAPPSVRSEWEEPFGMAAGANTGYGMMYRRHMYEYGTTEEQLAKVAADQRHNALTNENAVFNGQPVTVDDVLNSRYINYPLKLLETVMPCDGAAACVITSADRAKSTPNRPVYVLGRGSRAGCSEHLANAPDHDHAGQGVGSEGLPDGGIRSAGYAVRRILRLIHHPRGREPRRCGIC